MNHLAPLLRGLVFIMGGRRMVILGLGVVFGLEVLGLVPCRPPCSFYSRHCLVEATPIGPCGYATGVEFVAHLAGPAAPRSSSRRFDRSSESTTSSSSPNTGYRLPERLRGNVRVTVVAIASAWKQRFCCRADTKQAPITSAQLMLFCNLRHVKRKWLSTFLFPCTSGRIRSEGARLGADSLGRALEWRGERG